MKKIVLPIALLILLAACSGTPAPIVVVPTLAVLPSMTPSPIATAFDAPTATETPTLPSSTPIPTDTPSPTLTPAPTDTLIPTQTETPLPPTLTPLPSQTETPTATLTQTFTPSMTITSTITPTPSPTFTASLELDGLGLLALLSERATILPPEQRYNPPTLTAVAFAAQTLVAGGFALSPSPAAGTSALATLPAPTNCPAAPPDALSAADPTLTQALGCPQGALSTTTTAAQAFEHGSMLYVAGSPGSIYALTLDGRFRRFDDTWASGVDPETGGETPPLGLIEPKRGFGKVWRDNLDVRGSLGWGVTEEAGGSSPVQLFERGRALYLPQRGETYLLIDDPGGATGSWRTLPVSF